MTKTKFPVSLAHDNCKVRSLPSILLYPPPSLPHENHVLDPVLVHRLQEIGQDGHGLGDLLLAPGIVGHAVVFHAHHIIAAAGWEGEREGGREGLINRRPDVSTYTTEAPADKGKGKGRQKGQPEKIQRKSFSIEGSR